MPDGLANPLVMTRDGGLNDAVQAVKLNDWIHNQDSPVGDFWQGVADNLQSYYDQSQVGNQAISEIVENKPVYDELGALVKSGIAGDYQDAVSIKAGESANDTTDGTAISEAISGSPSVSDYLREHPGASAEDIMRFMAQYSDEWTEKWIDYALEKQSIADANAYTANREDTAYQRLVQDLKKAGLNPAMMYGSSAGTSSSGSAGVVNMTSGANSRSIGNYKKIKEVLLAYMLYNLKTITSVSNIVGNGLSGLLSALLG